MGTSDATVDASIGPQVDLATVELPPEIGGRLATVLGRSEPVGDAAAWATAMRAAVVEAEDRQPDTGDLCTAADGAHSFEPASGTGESFVCALDPLLVPFLTGQPGTVRSRPPVGGEVRLTVTGSGVTVEPEGAVLSLGVANAVTPGDLWSVCEVACPYIHAFPSRAAYEGLGRGERRSHPGGAGGAGRGDRPSVRGGTVRRGRGRGVSRAG